VTVVKEILSLFTNQFFDVLQFADLEKQNCTQSGKVVQKDYEMLILFLTIIGILYIMSSFCGGMTMLNKAWEDSHGCEYLVLFEGREVYSPMAIGPILSERHWVSHWPQMHLYMMGVLILATTFAGLVWYIAMLLNEILK
jgi:hypothetical protein